MDLVTLEKHFVDARRLARELLHRRYLALTAFSALCATQAIQRAQGQTVSTYERRVLRALFVEVYEWRSLAVLQVAVLRGARRALVWGRQRARVEAGRG